MIKINRCTPPINTTLDINKETCLKKIEEKSLNGKDFKKLWLNDKVKEFLFKSQHGKCCYCERKRDKKRESDVEHFRPKGAVEECPKHVGYWWLAYSWENLLISCMKCNQDYKKTRFPLEDESKRVYSKGEDIDQEKPILINPLTEDPEQFIEYDISDKNMVKAIGKNNRGKETVNKLTGINDTEVMIERFDKLKHLKILARTESKVISKFIKDHISPEGEFSGLSRFYFKNKGLL